MARCKFDMPGNALRFDPGTDDEDTLLFADCDTPEAKLLWVIAWQNREMMLMAKAYIDGQTKMQEAALKRQAEGMDGAQFENLLERAMRVMQNNMANGGAKQ